MKKDNLTNEFLTSSDWDDIVGWPGNFTLGVGYCYVGQLKDYFKTKNINYHFFDVKWGRCGTTYLFSALRPDNIIVLTAWKNSGIICNKTDTLFRIWGSILINLAQINVPMMIFDTPAAWQRSNLVIDSGSDYAYNRIKNRSDLYHKEVIEPCLNIHSQISYYDLSTIIPQNSILLHENFIDIQKTPSPWHLTSLTINTIGKYFIDTINHIQTHNTQVLINELNNLSTEELNRYEKTYHRPYEM